jgi:2-oxoglutarate ferredoxin oxidoreductase subunit delta
MDSSPRARKPAARVEIRLPWCKKCGICVAFCPTAVFTADAFGTPIISSPEKCVACGLCVLRCPEYAVKLVPLAGGTVLPAAAGQEQAPEPEAERVLETLETPSR